MTILVTGHEGYIGRRLVPYLRDHGYKVLGLDTGYFRADSCTSSEPRIESISIDVRDVEARHLQNVDTIIHLAGISNDPVSVRHNRATWAVNHEGTLRLARAAVAAHVSRLIFFSSCSVYGQADALVDESAPVNPLTPYSSAKLRAELDLKKYFPNLPVTVLRMATVYGASPSMRTDITLNNFAARAHLGLDIVIHGNSTSWRPMIHIDDIGRALAAVLDAPPEQVHHQTYNVGDTAGNYQVGSLAERVTDRIPGSRVLTANARGVDMRSYHVDFGRFAAAFPHGRPRRTLDQGIAGLARAYMKCGMTDQLFRNAKFSRLEGIARLQGAGLLDIDLRWRADQAA